MEEDLGERYRHLLQPLRDVQAVWDCNISGHLNDYLEKLRTDREKNIVTEDGETVKSVTYSNHCYKQHAYTFRFNFSEAAMLLQGSLFIFAKKVDYLHSEIAELFLNKGKAAKKRQQGKQHYTQFVSKTASLQMRA